LREKPWK